MTTPAPATPATTERELLRGAGLRVTGVRLAVLRALDGHEHSTADDVVRAVRADLGTASVQAVYDSLNALSAAGILRRMEPAGHPARYERRVGDNHHHIVCRGCGVVADVDCTVGHAPCLTPSETHGFAVDLAEVTFWGLCPACAPAR
jgi:Fur family transcriptional regulator, stress-responsive regulator